MTISNVEVLTPSGMPLNRVHGEYANLTPDQIADRARAKLQEYIDLGSKRATLAIRQILGTEIRDGILPLNRMRFGAPGEASQGRYGVQVGQHLAQLNEHALHQLASRVGLQIKFINERRGQDWGRQLVAHNLNELAAHSDERVLVRAVDGEVRGIMSNAYKTDDSRPALDALIQVAQEAGAVICDGDALTTKTSIKVVLAKPIELYPGEWAVLGLSYNNSDFGDGARVLNGFVNRLLCLNGAQITTTYRKVHLGARITDQVEYSTRTRQLNAQATASATRDMARALLGEEQVARFIQTVRQAHATHVDADQIAATLKTRVNKEEEKEISRLFGSADVENLPAGQNRWRFSNAISWLARNQEDASKRLGMEQLAGDVLTV